MQVNPSGTTEPVQPELERINGMIHVLSSNIHSNAITISDRLQKIYFYRNPEEPKTKKDVSPDDSSFIYQMELRIEQLRITERITTEILSHLDKIIG